MWSRFFSQPRQAVRPRRIVRKPILEQLDDRLTPATIAPFAVSAGGTLQDTGQGVAADAFGNVYVAGNIQGTQSAVDTDAVVTKYSATGVPLWSHVYGSLYDDSANAIAVDRAGYTYVAGNFGGQVAFSPGLVLTSTGQIDHFVIKLDPVGKVLWAHQFASNGNFGPALYDRLGTTTPKGIAVDHRGNVVVTGFFAGDMDMDPVNAGQHVLHSIGGVGGHPDAFVAKLDSTGKFVWHAQIKDVDGVNAYAIAVDTHDNVYTLGAYQNSARFVDSSGNSVEWTSATNRDTLYVWKLDAAGHTTWVNSGASGDRTFGLGIAVDKIGNVYSTGSFNGVAVDFNPAAVQAGDTLTSTGGSNDVWIEKIDSGGHLKWVRGAGGVGDDWGTGISVDVNGNPYVTGYVTASSMFGNQLLSLVSPLGNSFIAELSSAGNFLCAQKADDVGAAGPGLDKAAAIAVDGLGYVNITGSFARQEQWPGLPMLNSLAGSGDIFTIKTKLARSATQVSVTGGNTLRILGTDRADRIAIVVDPGTGILVTLDDEVSRFFAAVDYRPIDLIDIRTAGGADSVSIDVDQGLLLPATHVPNLRVDLGADADVLTIRSECPVDQFAPPTNWRRVDIKMGLGDDEASVTFGGSIPAILTAGLGSGNDTLSIHAAQGDVLPMPEEFLVSANGEAGDDAIGVDCDFIIEGGAPNPSARSFAVNLSGGLGDDILHDGWWWDAAAGTPGDPPLAFNVALTSNLDGGPGSNHLGLSYEFNAVTQWGATFPDMIIDAPITASLLSGGTNSTQKVRFFADLPTIGGSWGELAVNSALTFNGQAGTGDQAIEFEMGSAEQGGIMPVLLTGGTLTAHGTGGAGEDVMAFDSHLGASSTGRVNIEFHGAGGNDILTLGVYGYPDANMVSALLDGGTGWDTGYYTGGTARVLGIEQ